jgi:hypothetical protein
MFGIASSAGNLRPCGPEMRLSRLSHLAWGCFHRSTLKESHLQRFPHGRHHHHNSRHISQWRANLQLSFAASQLICTRAFGRWRLPVVNGMHWRQCALRHPPLRPRKSLPHRPANRQVGAYRMVSVASGRGRASAAETRPVVGRGASGKVPVIFGMAAGIRPFLYTKRNGGSCRHGRQCQRGDATA